MFTNWLTSETPNKSREAANPASVSPDVFVEVGPPPFARYPAHSTVLSSQSGFFRAAISRASEIGKLSENPIFLPNITSDHFTPLLSYMYTGFLDLNFENIFGVLLATHLLHMPRALEICRDFLAHSQRQQSDFYSSAVPLLPSPVSKVVRPIASKASSVGLNFVSPPKAPSNLLVPSHGTQFKTFGDGGEEKPPKVAKLSEKEETAKLDVVDAKLVALQPRKLSSSKSSSSHQTMSRKPVITEVQTIQAGGGESDKVVIDIASCDGPVRFRRILNEAYEQNKKQIMVPTSPSEVNTKVEYHQSNVFSFHQQMVRNINEQYQKQKSFSSQNSEESENSQHSGELYTCVYCNHTFKSKYCYQKHAKRHINPLNAITKCRDECESSDGDNKKAKTESSSASAKRDSIKPLDMNVQYYPCKTCGCKFPSYYFVHKHRKMCHPEIAADGSIQPMPNDDGGDSQSEVQVDEDHKANFDV